MIYFISEEGCNTVKIGVTNNKFSLENRINTMQTGNSKNLILIGVVKGFYKEEKKLHKKFLKHHIRGEWFKLSDDIISYFNKHNVSLNTKEQERIKHPDSMREELINDPVPERFSVTDENWHEEWMARLKFELGYA
jgi:hypothetical protein